MHGPATIVTVGTTPEISLYLFRIAAVLSIAAIPSEIRAPPESSTPMTGTPFLAAMSMTLIILDACAAESDPERTV